MAGPKRVIVQIACVIVAGGLWQALVGTGVLDRAAVATPSSVFRSLGPMLSTSEFWQTVGATGRSWGTGLLISVALALPLGLLLGSAPVIYRMFRLTIDFLRTIPPVALIPLALLLYGATARMALLLIVFGSVWPLLLQSIYGVHQVDPVTWEFARSYRLRRRDLVLRVVLPSAAPFVATGLRIAATMSLLLAVGAELIGGAPGVGNSIALAQVDGDVPRMYAFVMVAAVLGVLLNLLMITLERRTLSWHSSHRPGPTG